MRGLLFIPFLSVIINKQSLNNTLQVRQTEDHVIA